MRRLAISRTRCMALCLFAFSSVAHAQPSACEPPLAPMLRAELFFGRNLKTGGTIGESAWTSFLAQDVTPRFPQGLTILDGSGQWRNASGRIIRERSKVLLIVAPDQPDTLVRLQTIREAYMHRFGQQSVGIATHRVCGQF